MKIVITLTDNHAREVQYYLQKRYNSKKTLPKLARIAILREVANEAEKELKEMGVL